MKRIEFRILALVMAIMLVLPLAACGGNPTEAPAEDADVSTTEATSNDTAVESTTTGESTTTTAKKTGGNKKPAGSKQTTKTTTSGKKVVTFTKAEEYTEATTSAPKNPLRVLSIGHSFSVNAMERYLWDMLESSGKYDYIVIAYLYFPGCSLDRHWDHITSKPGTDNEGKPYEYEKYRKTDPYTGDWIDCYKNDEDKNLAATAIKDEQWDVITLQPSPDYGTGPENCDGNNDYDHVGDIVDWINSNKKNKNAKIYYHMTWSFSEDCKLWSFDYSDWNQMTQYKNFVTATKKYIFKAHPNKFTKIIPAGTAIQNARSSKLGDTFNLPGGYNAEGKAADGYHLNNRGCCVAALTWYCVLTGKKAATAACPSEWESEWSIFTKAVDAAVKTPYSVTKM